MLVMKIIKLPPSIPSQWEKFWRQAKSHLRSVGRGAMEYRQVGVIPCTRSQLPFSNTQIFPTCMFNIPSHGTCLSAAVEVSHTFDVSGHGSRLDCGTHVLKPFWCYRRWPVDTSFVHLPNGCLCSSKNESVGFGLLLGLREY